MKLKGFVAGCVVLCGCPAASLAQDFETYPQGLGILTASSACDTQGVPGITLASDNHCLQLRGGVTYQLEIGEFRDEISIARTIDAVKIPVGRYGIDWNTKVKSWIRFLDTSETDVGPATAVIALSNDDETKFWGSADGYTFSGGKTESTRGSNELKLEEAYVRIGDATRLMVGKKGSIVNLGDDNAFNYLSLFNATSYDGEGVGLGNNSDDIGGHVVQVESELGHGVRMSAGFESIGGADWVSKGTVVGSLAYAREGLSGHLSAVAFNVMGEGAKTWLLHAGSTAYFDGFKIRGAAAYRENVRSTGWNRFEALATAQADFRLFNVALSSEIIHNSNVPTGNFFDFGFGASVGMSLHKYVSANLGTRWFADGQSGLVTGQLGGQVNAKMTDTISVGSELGLYVGSKIAEQQAQGNLRNDVVAYAGAQMFYAPGGGFTAFARSEVNTEGAYKILLTTTKEFK